MTGRRDADIARAQELGGAVIDAQIALKEAGHERAKAIFGLWNDHGMTTYEIAAAIGLSQPRVSALINRYLRGDRAIGYGKCYRCGKTCQVRKDGTLRSHIKAPHQPWCEGSREPAFSEPRRAG